MGLLRNALGALHVGTFSGVQAHSPVPSVSEGATFLKDCKADAIIAVGGGSAAVTSRAAAIFLAEGGDLAVIATHRDDSGKMHSPRLSKPKLPQFIVPTTPTTAVVKAGTAVFDPAAGQRRSLFDPKTRATAIFLHPEFLRTSSPEMALKTSLDTLCVAVDGLISRRGDPIADALLIHAIRLLATALPQLTHNDSDALRETLSMAAVLCGRGTDQTGTGLTTVLGHAIGANHHVENGTAKALLLPHVLRFTEGHNPQGFANLALALGLSNPADAAGTLQGLFLNLGLPDRLSSIGIAQDAIAGIAERAMLDWFLRDCPRKITDGAEIASLLAEAL